MNKEPNNFFVRSASQHHHDISKIKLNNFVLETVKSMKYLGIGIDETFSWNKETKKSLKKLIRMNGILSKLRYHAPP